jgi:amino acid adenylation domain-containing protein
MQPMLNRSYGDKLAVIANQKTEEREYWMHQLSGMLEKSNFPFDFTKENIIETRMETVKFRFQGELFSKLKKLSNHSDVKLNMILVAGLETLLRKYTGSNDIKIGAPIYQQEMDCDFINTILVLRNRLEDSMTFKQLLLQVRKTINEATKNQNYPIEFLAGPLNIPVLGNEFPFFDIIILLHNIHYKKYIQGVQYHMLFAFDRTDQYIEADLEYNASLYRDQTIEQIINHFTRLMEKILLDVNVELSCVDILSEQEKHQILVEFNANAMDFPKDKTFSQLFEEQVARAGDTIAVIGMGHGASGMASITYNKLKKKSNQLAWILREKGVQPDNVVGLMVDRSIEMIIGVLGILKSGGAYLSLDPTYPKERINFILKDSNAGILLKSEIRSTKSDATLRSSPLRSTRTNPNDQNSNDENWGVTSIVLNFEHLNFEFVSNFEFRASNLSSSNLAYVIYTSGSTGRPKGVMVQHNHFVNMALGWRKEYRLQEMEVHLLQMASFSFDVFAGDLARTFLNQGKMVINPQLAQDPESLYQLIISHRVTLFESTPSYIIPFMNYVDKNNLNIRSLQLLILGSDTCPSRDFKALAARFGKQMRIVNSYGVTEATIDSSYYEPPDVEELPSAGSVPIGKPLPNVKFYILDSAGNPLPKGVPGELFIGGESVSRGYLNNPELTSDKFGEIQDNIPVGTGGLAPLLERAPLSGRLYHSGDLARWLPDGNVEFLGRMDDQVKVRGYRIELGEIENKLLEHENIKEAVVVQKTEATGDRYLCGYIVSDQSLEAPVLRDFLADKLPDYMIPWFFIQLERFPLTPNGKIDRKALPEPEAGGVAEYILPRDEMEKELVKMWAEVLSVESEKIGIDTDFFDLGGNSLKAIILVSRIKKTFSANVSLEDIFNIQTIRGLAQSIKGADKTQYISIPGAREKEYYVLSPAQKRLYTLQQFDRKSTAYNMPLTVLLEGKTGKERLEETFKALIDRHESLRTSFEMVDEEPMQKIHKNVEFEIVFYDLTSNQAEVEVEEGIPHSSQAVIENFVTPFDLSQAPLLRVGLIKWGEEKQILITDMHHIISDAVSHGILIQDFLALYRGDQLPALTLQYKDYSEWQNRDEEREALEQQEAYWLKQFKGHLPKLNLHLDYPRPRIWSSEGDVVNFSIGKARSNALKELALQEGVTLQMMMVAIFHILLSRITGQEDIITGTTTIGRRHADLERIIGLFVNTLVLRSFPSGEKTFRQYLKEVREMSLKAYENQDYPFDDLAKKVAANVNSEPGRNPIFDIMFEIQSYEASASKISVVENPGLKLLPYEMEFNTTKFDQDWVGKETSEGISFSVSYGTKLFKPETIELMVDGFLLLIENVLKNVNRNIKIKGLDHRNIYQKELDQVQKVSFDF